MIIKGKAYWAKVLKPVLTYAKDGEEYTIDVTVDAETKKALEDAGIGHKVKPATNSKGNIHASGTEYIKISIPTKTPKGDALKRPDVQDKYGRAWDPEVLIGNGSEVAVMFSIRSGETTSGPWAKPSLRKVMVTDHVELEPQEEFDFVEAVVEEVWTDDED